MEGFRYQMERKKEKERTRTCTSLLEREINAASAKKSVMKRKSAKLGRFSQMTALR